MKPYNIVSARPIGFTIKVESALVEADRTLPEELDCSSLQEVSANLSNVHSRGSTSSSYMLSSANDGPLLSQIGAYRS